MPAPEVRSVGASTFGTVAITLSPAAGIEVGDLLIAIFESGGPTGNTAATNALTATGYTSAPSSPQQVGNTRLTILYRIATGSDACTTNDTGDHQAGRMIAIKKGTFNAAEPFNTSAGSTLTPVKAVVIPGATTTVAECLILAVCSGHLPDAATTTEFSEWANSNLTSVTERIDNTRIDGDGWALGAATGVKAAAGAYGATTATAVTEAERGVISLAIAPAPSPHVAALGKASEVDTAGSLPRRKSRTIGQAIETDASSPLVKAKTRLLGQAIEVEVARSITSSKSRTLGQAAEVEQAQALGEAKARSLGQAIETEQAEALVAFKTQEIGQAAEIDTAPPISVQKARQLQQASETSEAKPITAFSGGTLGQASETDYAFPLVLRIGHGGTASVTEESAGGAIVAEEPMGGARTSEEP